MSDKKARGAVIAHSAIHHEFSQHVGSLWKQAVYRNQVPILDVLAVLRWLAAWLNGLVVLADAEPAFTPKQHALLSEMVAMCEKFAASRPVARGVLLGVVVLEEHGAFREYVKLALVISERERASKVLAAGPDVAARLGLNGPWNGRRQ